MDECREQYGDFLKGFFIGCVLGTLAGVLFAPKSGKELRSDIKEKGSNALKDAKKIYDEANEKARAIINEARQHAAELKREAECHMAEARQKARDILSRHDKKEADQG